MIDKEYIKQLAKKLYIELDDEQLDKVTDEINEMEKQLAEYRKDINPATIPADYPRVKNCAVLRKDIISKPAKKDYLSNAKVADKYVVGK